MNRASYVSNIRTLLQDQEIYNELLGGKEELTDSEITLALMMELEYYNNVPPALDQYELEDFPAPYQLINGAAGRSLLSVCNRHDRNRLEYNDGGVSVRVNDKADRYRPMAAAMLQEWREFVLRHKVSRNMAGFTDTYSPMGRGRGTYDI